MTPSPSTEVDPVAEAVAYAAGYRDGEREATPCSQTDYLAAVARAEAAEGDAAFLTGSRSLWQDEAAIWEARAKTAREEITRLRKVLEAIGGLTRERATKDAVRTALSLREYRGPLPPSTENR